MLARGRCCEFMLARLGNCRRGTHVARELEPPKAKNETCWSERTRVEKTSGERTCLVAARARYWIPRMRKRGMLAGRVRERRRRAMAESWMPARRRELKPNHQIHRHALSRSLATSASNI